MAENVKGTKKTRPKPVKLTDKERLNRARALKAKLDKHPELWNNLTNDEKAELEYLEQYETENFKIV